MFRSRLLTAIIAVPLVLLVIFYSNDFYFSLVMLAVTGVGAWEWSRLIGFTRLALRIFYTLLVVAAVFGGIFVPERLLFLIAGLTVIWSSIAVVLYQLNRSPAGFQWPAVRFITGIILLASFCLSSVFLKDFPFVIHGSWLLFYVMLLVWVSDTAGYFFGRAFGKHLLIPRVSPKKTWEGLVGSLICGFFVALGFALLLKLSIGFLSYKVIILSFFTVIFSVPGDLFISVLKRQVGVKDSGVIFPGHGGMLDRIDSLIAGAIIFVFGILFFLSN
jgi:phosphatidate cytidylyltransferase